LYSNGFTITAIKSHGNTQFPNGAWVGQIDGYCCTGPVHTKHIAQSMAIAYLRDGGYLTSLVICLETYLSCLSNNVLTETQKKEVVEQIADLCPRVEKTLGAPFECQGKGWLRHDAYRVFEQAKRVLGHRQGESEEIFCGTNPR